MMSRRPPQLRQPPSRRPVSALLGRRALAAGGRLAVLMALAALFAMHGLSDHGTSGHVITHAGAHALHGSGDTDASAEHHQVGGDPHASHGQHAVGTAVDGATDASTAAAAAAATMLAASPTMASALTGAVPGAVTGAVDGPSGHGGHGLMGLCLAVLAGALTLVLVATLARGRRPLFVITPAGSMLPTVAARARDPDPPDLRLLSIQRC